MKQTYEKPFSAVVQMATENIIAASQIMAVMSTDLNMDVESADVWGNWE